MANKTIKTRIVQKHASETDWQKATGFTPLKGEIIVYDTDSNHSCGRFKIGDGETLVNELPFYDESINNDIASIKEQIQWGSF